MRISCAGGESHQGEIIIAGLKQKLVLMLIAVSVAMLGWFSAWTMADTPIKIMPLGDSITKGVGTTPYNGYRKSLYLNLTNTGYNVDFVGGETHGDFANPNHEGHAGWHAKEDGTVYDVYDQVYGWLVATPPEIVLLHIGTNDITSSGEDANEVSDILDEIDIYEADSNEAITVILALIIDRQTHSPATTQFNIDVNDMAQNRIAAGDDVIVVDMEHALIYPDDMADIWHPNDAGYEKMAWVWYDALDSLLGVAPIITSTPLTDVTVGQLYTYNVNATGCPEPSYTLTECPNDMTIDPHTGLIEWTPTTVGGFDITVEASNGKVPDANQGFTITVKTIIEFDANSSTSNGSAGTTLSWPHTIGNGSNRLLVVGIVGKDQSTTDLGISSVTYGAAPMTLVAETSKTEGSGWYIKTELYYLLDSNLPPAGSYDVNVTYSGNVKRICTGAVSLRNVEQQPAEAVNTNYNENSDTISTNITTPTNGSWLIDVIGCSNQGIFDVNDGDEQIERFDVNSVSSAAAGSTKAAAFAGSTTMGWTFSYGAERLVHSIAAFAPPKMLVISGYIENFCEVPIKGVLVDANNGGGLDITDANGFYEVWVYSNWSGTVTPSKAHYTFDPNSNAYAYVLDDVIDQNYTATNIYDLDCDGSIGFGDLGIISENWLDGPDLPGDFYKDEDDIVNFLDFADFANVWGD